MKILYIARNLILHRRQDFDVILYITRRLIKRGHQVEVVFPKEIVPFWLQNKPKFRELEGIGKHWSSQGVDGYSIIYLRLPLKSLAFSFMFESFDSLPFDPAHFDLIHAHYIYPDGIMAYRLARRFGLPFMVSIRGSDLNILSQVPQGSATYSLAEKVIEGAARVHVLNNRTARVIQSFVKGLNPVLIPHGLTRDQLEFDIGKKASSKDRVVISTVCTMVPLKHIDWLIKAVRSYAGSQFIQLILVGDGPLYNALEEMAGGDSRISFTGKLSRMQVFEILEVTEIFAMPSKPETFGIVFLEAASRLNALIGREGEGPDGVFERNKEMFFARDFDHFQSLLYRLIEDPQLRREMAEKARRKVLTLEWSKIIDRFEEVYHSMIT